MCFADKIFLNKIDLCTREQLDAAHAKIKEFNEKSPIEEVQFNNDELPLQKLLDLDMFSIQRALDDATGNSTGRVGSCVVFPSGTYRVSSPLQVPAHAMLALTLRGVGVAVLEQAIAGSDIITALGVWRLEVSHLYLRGGRHQLHLGNHNTDQGYYYIHDTSFDNSSGVAINIMKGTPSTQLVVTQCKVRCWLAPVFN